VSTSSAKQPLGAYSQAMIEGDLVFVSSCTAPKDPDTGETAATLAARRTGDRQPGARARSRGDVARPGRQGDGLPRRATAFPEFDEV
jgi:hypothetical protein